MALVLKDRVKETTTTTGTGTVTLAGASTGYQSFSVIGNANTTYYCIAGQGTAEWEVGIGTYTASGTTLSRDTILASSNSGSVVTFSAGTKDVFVVYPAGKSVNLDASNNATALGTVASATLTNATGLPISTGVSGLGTGVATALAVNTGSSGAFVVNGGALGTPSSGTVTNLTGTASININGTVGATTPSTGAFTTLSASGVATFSAGSAAAPAITTSGDTNTGIFFPAADTIAFTEGGAEAMRIDSSGNVLIGSPTYTRRLSVKDTTNTVVVIEGSNSGSSNINFADSDSENPGSINYSHATNYMAFQTAGAERARITSSGVFYLGSLATNFSFTNGSAVDLSGSGTGLSGNGTNLTLGVWNGPIVFQAGNSGGALVERARIDSSGNVGIGTSSPNDKLTVASDNYLSFQTSSTTFNSGRVARIGGVSVGSGNGYLVFETYQGGSGGGERMRIDSSGNVGIGTSSPASKLDVNGTIRDSIGNVRSIIQNAQTTGYTLVSTDNGKHISITTGGVTVPASIFSAGDVVTIFNNSGSNQTITQGASVTLRFAGTATTGNRTLAQYGVCTVLCVASNTFVISGAGLT